MPISQNGDGQDWEMVGTKISLIWSVSEQDCDQLTVGPALGLCLPMIRWPIILQSENFLLRGQRKTTFSQHWPKHFVLLLGKEAKAKDPPHSHCLREHSQIIIFQFIYLFISAIVSSHMHTAIDPE